MDGPADIKDAPIYDSALHLVKGMIATIGPGASSLGLFPKNQGYDKILTQGLARRARRSMK